MTNRMLAGWAALAAAAALAGPVCAQAPDPKVAHADYANPALWLCKPGIADNKCNVDLTATVIAANGKTTIETFKPAKDPKVDCFFVYPTVSMDPGWQSDFVADHMEWDDIKLQFARFGSVCRLFAPIYRQGTLTGLRVASGGAPPAGERPPATQGGYNDVVDAWNAYMAHDNKGRGVILIGHSQGAGLVARLVAGEIEGKPVQKQFISAVVLGSPVLVANGKDTGGTLKAIPLCHAEDQLGCVINYSTFRDTNPPPPESRFGKGRDGQHAGCTNPANLATGKGTNDAYFLTRGFLNGSAGPNQPDWTTAGIKITTPFVKVPGLVSTECQSKGDFTWLAMHVNADP